MKKLSHDQKIILAEFMSNFSLAWISFGLIGPSFTGIDNVNNYFLGVILSFFVALISISFSLNLVK